MIGILLVTHGKFSEEIVKSAELIVGKQEKILTLGLQHGDSVEMLGDKVKESVKSLEDGDGVLVLVDLMGGSPYNVVALNSSKLLDINFRCITGVNLPMLLEAITMREIYNLDDLTDHCIEIGTTGIKELFKEMELLKK
ncbi:MULTISPECIES: PTS sugar transporter subunit IIA [Clostridium]|uniref:PTS system fructose IIA component n=1 Tax=Clostridium botulinum (strain Eklund 17B / Type B) TaxID=935198 RepID=B2TQY0_CLOBB|nr:MULTISPECIES: PTS sugar transporter subunit IIA [Clostridium]ACD22400.1 PTS system fructose IIA component [Clostridium botulinum B str. Eklund 17B (NRP)]MBN1053465.1 PTS sugar transporter subunit IIA [Clostridium botulinum]MBY6975722.1 PTS sugar transporter subunit IIA [Clostridium botulinum]MBY7001271.1 PTS sugar transporter subunit IIA [Clostridium botulinum]MCR1274038.1 PTS sugar transporter subunit IIA [Clostridium botulinum]